MSLITTKGSQWRKWDLHIHTPESILNQEFGSDWDEYVRQLFKKAIEKRIAAIGITDYYSIEGYKKIREEYLDNPTKLQELFSLEEIADIKNILVLPNIEFRIKKLVIGGNAGDSWNNKVNGHLILSDEISVHDIEENLLGRLDFVTGTGSGGMAQTKPLTKSNLEKLGRTLKTHHSKFNSETDYKLGAINASVCDDKLFEVLNKSEDLFRGKYFFCIPSDEDLSKISWNGSGHMDRKALIQKSHLMLCANPKTIQFGLGKFHETEEKFKEEFSGLKPCIWGSDAHTYEKLFEPDQERYTWIKSDPTFEGLKQVLHEPKERVRIQKDLPEEKTPYLVIGKVEFVDREAGTDFGNQCIALNDNLNVIIGGKSSGKSLLLYHIAKAIDPQQVEEKTKVTKNSVYDDSLISNFKVHWKSKYVSEINQNDAQGRITYIPQLYINILAEEEGEDQLQELINSILNQSDEYKAFVEQQQMRLDRLDADIRQQITTVLQLEGRQTQAKRQLKESGDKEQIEGEIERLDQIIEQLKNDSGFSKKERLSYDDINSKKANVKGEIDNSNGAVNSSNTLLSFFSELESSISLQIESKSQELKLENNVRTIVDSLQERASQLINDSATEVKKYISAHEQKIAELTDKVTEMDGHLHPFEQKLQKVTLLRETNNRLEEQKRLLSEWWKNDNQYHHISEELKVANEKLRTSYEKLLTVNSETENKLESKTIEGSDLELNVVLDFDTDSFSNSFVDLFDKRANLSTQFGATFQDNSFVFKKGSHIENIRDLFERIQRDSSSLRLKSNVSQGDLYHQLFKDYFRIKYSVKYQGDDLSKMSPGKRGLVLLQLLLHISNAKYPILIDQPEDNLDNRTVYNELKQLIRTKKVDRQIIMVTHNANLVVSTDAENIIVANQSGQQNRDNEKYRFEYVNGALENTFSNESESAVLHKKGIREHVCEILEGGKDAFLNREKKYGFT